MADGDEDHLGVCILKTVDVHVDCVKILSDGLGHNLGGTASNRPLRILLRDFFMNSRV